MSRTDVATGTQDADVSECAGALAGTAPVCRSEMLGMSERSFRRYRRRHEDDGLDGLFDRRLDKASARRVPADRIEWVLEQYRTRHTGWTVKHFHDHLCAHHGFAWSYTWTKTTLQRAGLVSKAPRRGAHRRRRPRKPCVGMMLHQDGSRHEWLAGQAACDLIVTMDDATSEIYSAFLVEEEGTASTFRALKQVFTDKGMPSSLYTDRGSHYFHTPEAGGKVAKDQHTQVGRALHQLGIEHNRCLFARGARPLRARLRHPPGPPRQGTGVGGDRDGRSRRPLHRRHLPARPQSPLHHPARTRRQRLRAPRTPRPDRRHPLPAHRAHSRPRQHRALRKARPPDSRHPSHTTTSRPGSGSTSIQTEPSPSSTGPTPRPLHRQRRARRNPNPAGRVRRFDATGRRPVDKWTAAPRLTTSPQGQPQQQKRTYDVLRKPDKSTC